MSQDWQVIDTTPKSVDNSETEEIEVIVEGEDEEVTPEEIEVIQAETEDTAEPEEKEAAEEVTESEEQPKRKKVGRAQKRIKQLIDQTKEKDVQLAAKDEEIAKLRKAQKEASKNTARVRKDDLDNLIISAKRDQAKALAENDPELLADSTEKLADYKVQQMAYGAYAAEEDSDDNYEDVQQPKEAPAPTARDLPDALVEWVEDKDWFTDPESRDERKLHRYAIKVSTELENEGYSVAEDDFYKELDLELNQFVKDNNLTVDGFEKPVKSRQQVESPVAPSRSEGKKTKKTVRLTKEQRELARSYNLNEKEYALRLEEYEKNGGKGYMNVFGDS
jgi:hypothetical protein